MRSLDAGVTISELASSWVPFIIHSSSLLAEGGRLAMVVPAEIGHARYAQPLLDYLRRSFRSVTFLTFQKRLFPDLSEDTLLLLAESKGNHSARFLWKDFEHAGALKDLPLGVAQIAGSRRLETSELADGAQRLIEQFLPKRARDLYAALKRAHLTRPLGEIADVGIGYVTGDNSFFHVNDATIREYQIPEKFLKRAVRRGRSLTGLQYTYDDWERADSSYLLNIGDNTQLPAGIQRYLETGVEKGVTKGFKCRTRKPWFRVPHVYRPDAFLSYMSGHSPRLVANEADAVAPNTLHVLRLHANSMMNRGALATLWQTSLTQLSAEIEGHPLGGGMLKLEPTEAERVLVAYPTKRRLPLDEIGSDLDSLVRAGREEEAQRRADEQILVRGLGLTDRDCRLLASSAQILRDRRSGKESN
jgi:adenine-specific DNA methylase